MTYSILKWLAQVVGAAGYGLFMLFVVLVSHKTNGGTLEALPYDFLGLVWLALLVTAWIWSD